MVTLKNYAIFFFATLIAILSYTGIIKEKDKPISTLASLKDTSIIYGKLISNPTKMGKYYTARLSLFYIEKSEKTRTINYSAKGKITVFLQSSTIESHYPGLLFTAKKGNRRIGDLYETGARVRLSGTLKKDKDLHYNFFATEAKVLGFGESILDKIFYIRAICRINFKKIMYRWGEAGGLVLALLSGSREYLSLDIREAFRLSGLSFILALSGMHLSFFATMFSFVGKRTLGANFAYIFELSAVLIFVWFAGASPSLLRSLMCLILYLTLSRINLQSKLSLNVISCVFLLHRFMFPQDIYTLAFILSYTAILGIILFTKPLERLLAPLAFLATPSAVSLAALTFTFPLSLAIFSFANPITPLASVVVSPFISIFMATSLAAVLICLIFPDIIFLIGAFMQAQYTLINYLVSFFASFPAVHI